MTPSQALNAAERTGFPSELYVCSPVLSIEDSAREWLHPITVQHQARLLLSSHSSTKLASEMQEK